MKSLRLCRYAIAGIALLAVLVSPGLPAGLARTAAGGSAAAPLATPGVRGQAAGGWEEVGAGSASGGGISNSAAESTDPMVAIAPDGTPYVVWGDIDSTDPDTVHVYLRRWTGSAWEALSSDPVNWVQKTLQTCGCNSAVIAIAPDGTPYLARSCWDDNTSWIEVWRWNGSSWTRVDGGLGPYLWQDDPSMAFAPDGTLYVARVVVNLEGSWNTNIYVMRWDGSIWAEVESTNTSGCGISDTEAWSSDPGIAVAPDGTPYVAWLDDSSVYIRRWNRSTWEEVGSGSASGGGISAGQNAGRPEIAIAPDGTPYVTWARSGYIETRHWDGDNWQCLDAIDASEMVGYPVLAVAGEGRPYVAWADSSMSSLWANGSIRNAEIYVRQWSGAGWREVGSGSASGGGISDNAGVSLMPSIALAPDGTVYVAWVDDTGGSAEIYVRRRAGCAAFLPLVSR